MSKAPKGNFAVTTDCDYTEGFDTIEEAIGYAEEICEKGEVIIEKIERKGSYVNRIEIEWE